MDKLCVVVTGGSSGVGRATAHAFARRGADVVLVARAPGPLDDAAQECEALGGRAVPVVADVTDAREMRLVADRAAERFGSLDVWVNNAGLGVVGRFHEVLIEDHHKIIETNLLGYLNGAHAALPTSSLRQRHLRHAGARARYQGLSRRARGTPKARRAGFVSGTAERSGRRRRHRAVREVTGAIRVDKDRCDHDC